MVALRLQVLGPLGHAKLSGSYMPKVEAAFPEKAQLRVQVGEPCRTRSFLLQALMPQSRRLASPDRPLQAEPSTFLTFGACTR